MNLHEYQGKQLFKEYGLPVSEGYAADTPQEAVEAADRIGGSQSQIIVAMRRKNCPVDILNVFLQVRDFLSVLVGKAVACRIGNVDNRGSGRNHLFDYLCQEFVGSSACIFGIELHIWAKSASILHGFYSTLDKASNEARQLGLKRQKYC